MGGNIIGDMDKDKIKEYSNLKNKFGESVILVGATKYQPVDVINQTIEFGLENIGENKADEFRDKFEFYASSKKHFIGHLQTNKIKYLVGKVDLYHSIDSIHLAQELNKASIKNNVISNILIQINIGKEETKSGFDYDEIMSAYNEINAMKNLKIEGLMAMLPKSQDDEYLRQLVKKMRKAFDDLKNLDKNIKYLSMGMSHDYKLCVEEGANMIRIGSGIFGPRPQK